MMSEEVQELLKLQKQRKGQRFLNGLMMAGMAAGIAITIILWTDSLGYTAANRQLLLEVQESLKTTCDAAPLETLPESVQADCVRAANNELPAMVQGIDDPDPNDPETQDPEQQDREQQDPEIQDGDPNDPDPVDDPDANDDADSDDPEIQDEEIQDEEIQEEEVQEGEIQDPEEQNSPVCPDGYTAQTFHYFGPDAIDGTGDEEDWLICKKVG